MSLALRRLFVALVASSLVSVAGAQVAPTVGDLYFHSPSVQGGSSSAGALVRWDPLTGVGEVFVDYTHEAVQPQGAAYDPVRGGVVFTAGLFDAADPTQLWFVDGAGALTNLGLPDVEATCLTPAPDGKLYFRASTTATGLEYLDVDGSVGVLTDASGAAPFAFLPSSWFTVESMAFHAPTRSLVAAGRPELAGVDCDPGGPTTSVVLRRLPLSADGTRVVGPVTCTVVDVASGGWVERASGLDVLPDGDLLLVVRAGVGAQPRMVRVDVETMTTSTFATNGPYSGDTRTDAGAFSRARGEAVVVDTLNDWLRSFAEGETGGGDVIVTTPPTGTPGLSGGEHTLFDIHAAPCAGAWLPFGGGLAGAGGWEPVLAGGGCPQPGVVAPLSVRGGRGAATGVLFVGTTPVSLPFKGGALHVAPIALSVALQLGGTPGAPGAGELDLPAVIPAGTSGLSLFLQAAFVDPAAPVGVSLTSGLELSIG